MKTTLSQLVIGSVLILASLFTGTATAETVIGRITFVGTLPSLSSQGVLMAVFRIRVSESTCGADPTPMDRWIHVISGRMDAAYSHNGATFSNAYSTMLVAFLTGHTVQIDAFDDTLSCDASVTQTINSSTSNMGMF